MENRRSTGVTVFGLLFIVLAVLGFLAFWWPSMPGQIYPTSVESATKPARITQKWISSFLLPGLSLLAGTFILRLKEWARKLVIGVRIAVVIATLVIWMPFFNMFRTVALERASMQKAMREAAEEKRADLQKIYQPEYQEKILKSDEKFLDNVNKAGPALFYSPFFLIIGWPIAWNGIIIFYFTRSKVKEQFT